MNFLRVIILAGLVTSVSSIEPSLFSKRHERRKKNTVTWPVGDYSTTNDMVNVDVHILSMDETKSLFDGAGFSLTKKNNVIAPIQISISNHGTKALLFDPLQTDLSLVSAEQVTALLKKSKHWRGLITTFSLLTASTVLCAAAASLVCFVILEPLFGGALFGGITGVSFATSTIAQSAFLPIALQIGSIACFVAAPIGGVKVESAIDKHNMQLAEQVENQTITNQQLLIKPGESKKFFLFVKIKDIVQSFKLVLINVNNSQETLKVPIIFDSTADAVA